MNVIEFPRSAARPKPLMAPIAELDAKPEKLDKQTLLIVNLVMELMAVREQARRDFPR